MQINADVSEILKTAQRDLFFISNVVSESSIHFAQFSIVLAKKILLVSHKMAFIEKMAALLCVIMQRQSRAFATTI